MTLCLLVRQIGLVRYKESLYFHWSLAVTLYFKKIIYFKSVQETPEYNSALAYVVLGIEPQALCLCPTH